MLCLGHRCEMRDVFIAYDAKDYNRIKKKLEADRRYTTPAILEDDRLTVTGYNCRQA